MALTRAEQETIITFNEQDKEAEVFTYNGRFLRELAELAGERPAEVKRIRTNTEGGSAYRIPKKWVKIRAGMLLTEEQRKARSERGRRAAANLKYVDKVPSETTQQQAGV